MNQTTSNSQKLISVIVPAYNEEEVIRIFHQRLIATINSQDDDFEIIYVNDGSTDSTAELLRQFCNDDKRVGFIDLSRNFGKEIAMTSGIDHARGDAVIVIDADLQDPPELIAKLVEKWNEGFDIVNAQRESRAGETWFKKYTAHVFYRLIKRTTNVNIPEDTGDYRLLDRKAVDALAGLRERNRFMKGLFAWIGYNSINIPYQRDKRFAGTTKWNYWRLWNLAIEGFTSFTTAPLKISTYIGMLTAALSLVYGIYIIARTLMFGNPIPGYPSLIVIILFIGGVQLISIGIIGEYLSRVFEETKKRPLYLIKEQIINQTRESRAKQGPSNDQAV